MLRKKKVEGKDRYAAIVAFNERFYGLRSTERSILSHVAYVVRSGTGGIARESNEIAKVVAEFMATHDWVSRYGLSYTDTMKLTYDAWIRMQRFLIPKNTQES